MSRWGARKAALVPIAVAIACFGSPCLGCGPADLHGLGQVCSSRADCRGDLQCFGDRCTELCETDIECGGGFVCSDDGHCTRVDSNLGDTCVSEHECGPGQSCRLDIEDTDDDGSLAATCQPDFTGTVAGSACSGDDVCRSGMCALGRCVELCVTDTDCTPGLACVDMPRLLVGSAPMFRGCLQTTGSLELDVPIAGPNTIVRIPVPGHARSFALVTAVDDPSILVGATRVEDPSGALLYELPQTIDDFYANPLRYAPASAISTLFVPNTPTLIPSAGVYTVSVASLQPDGTQANAVPEARVIYQLREPGRRLDLHMYFLNLTDHPCSEAFDTDGLLSAESAQLSTTFQTAFLARVEQVFAQTSITLGDLTYVDLPNRPDLDAIDSDELPRLLELSNHASGINLFFVRSLSPVGVQALAGGTPGPPNTAGTGASGVVVSLDTLCYRDWPTLARSTGHAIARQLGLFRNAEPDGQTDPIPDTDESSANLMYFSEFGGIELTPNQAEVLRRNPGVRQ